MVIENYLWKMIDNMDNQTFLTLQDFIRTKWNYNHLITNLIVNYCKIAKSKKIRDNKFLTMVINATINPSNNFYDYLGIFATMLFYDCIFG